MHKHIQKLVSNVPKCPGVYIFKDKNSDVLYVGKAKVLQKRVKSYFQNKQNHSIRIQKLVSQVNDIDYTVTSSELEAVILETNLIKEFRPKYNILMKDDKNFVYIKITINEDFPRISIVRKIDNDNALYFGPKTTAHKVKKTLKILKKLFPYRHCNLFLQYEGKGKIIVKNKGGKYPCLDYHIGRCIGPCIGDCTKEEYRAIIDKIINFLKGKTDELINSLKAEMQKAASDKKFEKAAKLRDKLKAVEEISEKQLVSDPSRKNTDAVNYVKRLGRVYITLFMIRDGKLINQENFFFKSAEISDEIDSEEEILHAFIQQYYEKTTDFPKEVLIPCAIKEKTILEQWLSKLKNNTVKITIPKKGEKHKILKLAHKNAETFANKSQAKWQVDEEKRKKALEELKDALALNKIPKRIECYDISHLSGTNQVGSMIVFENGAPANKRYRRFKIKTIKEGKPDDFAAMSEVLKRRFLYLEKSKCDIKIRKLSNKDLKNYKNLNTNDYLKGILNNKIIATAKQEKYDKLDHFTDIKFKPLANEIKKEFISALIKRAKKNRVYVTIGSRNKKIIESIGFQNLRKIPKEIQQKTKNMKNKNCLLFNKLKYENEKVFSTIPDLIVLDGGKGQLSSGVSIKEQYELEIPIIALAKKNEDVYVPKRNNPITLPKDSDGLYLLQQIRDEAHRFALSYHHKLRSKTMLK